MAIHQVLMLSMVVGLVVGCGRSTPTATTATVTVASVPMDPPDPSAWPNTSFVSRNWTFTLVPASEAAPAEGPNDLEIWRGLLSGIASDPATPEVLSQICGGWPAQFVRLDGPDATDAALQASPEGDNAFVLRAANLGAERGGRGRLVGTIAYGFVSKTRPELPTPTGPGGAVVLGAPPVPVAPNTPPPPPASEAFLVLVHDYLLRHHPAWRLATPDDDGKEPPATDPDARRATLDHRIKNHAQQIRDSQGVPINASESK